MIDLASALILTLCPENGSICDPFMTLKFESFEHVENLESYIIYRTNCWWAIKNCTLMYAQGTSKELKLIGRFYRIHVY
jgi:hypothetical protein